MMLGKERTHKWFEPLMAHAGLHAAMTMCIALWFNPLFLWLSAIDLIIHATVDRGKAVAARALSTHQGERMWWQIFGVDQMLHHLTHLTFAVVLVMR